jgi:hypothetical protein
MSAFGGLQSSRYLATDCDDPHDPSETCASVVRTSPRWRSLAFDRPQVTPGEWPSAQNRPLQIYSNVSNLDQRRRCETLSSLFR